MESRLTELEIRYMRLEKTIQELSDVVYRQEREIGRLSRELDRLRVQVGTLDPGGVTDPGEEPPPPHY
jgi:SlyX protein